MRTLLALSCAFALTACGSSSSSNDGSSDLHSTPLDFHMQIDGPPHMVDLGHADSSMMTDMASGLTAAVSIGDDFFAPQTVSVMVGGTVTWTWTGFAPHTVTSGTEPSAYGKFCNVTTMPSVDICITSDHEVTS
jgi:plastocyanin